MTIDRMALLGGLRVAALGLLVALTGCEKDPAPSDGKAAGGEKAKAADAAESSAEKPGKEKPAAQEDSAKTGAPAAGLPPAEEILAKAAEAAGGADAFAKVESFYYEGAVEVVGQGLKGATKAWWKSGDFFTEQDMGGVGRVRAGRHGNVIWSQDPVLGLRKIEGLEADQVTWASSLLLAADWKRHFSKAQTIGEREEGGKKYYDVKLSSESGGELTMTFDAESGLHVSQEFAQITPMGKMPLSIKLEDYRDVGGIKVAFKQVTDASVAVAVLQLTKVELNVEVSEARFQMPKSGAETVGKAVPGGPAPGSVSAK